MDQTMTITSPVESSALMGTSRGKVGMWLFLASDAITFGALLVAYAIARVGSPAWPVPSQVLNVPLTALNTFILICSSVTMVKALSAIRHGDLAGLKKFLGATILGGAVFLGIQAFEWTRLIGHDGLSLRKDLFCATFFSLTGFHGFHVLCGVLYLLYTLNRARLGDFTAERNERIEIAGLYWHFVDLVWILVFTFVYLI